MKRYFLPIFIFLSYFTSWGQQVSVENISNNSAIVAMDNYLNIIVENISCKNLIVTSDNGSIEKVEDKEKNCQHIFTPKNVGIANISIYKMSHNEVILIESKRYRILPWPEQYAFLSLSGKTEMTKGEFNAHSGLVVPIEGLDMSGKIPIESYEIEVVRKGKIAYFLNNEGNEFSEENSITLKALKNGDIVLFKNILCNVIGESSPRKLDDLKIKIIKG